MGVGLYRIVAAIVGVAALTSLTTSAFARPGCDAAGQSDGSTASAAAWCLYEPDGLPLAPLPPLDCEVVTYEVVIPDDTVTAVFPTQVIQNYSPSLPTNYESAGHDNHHGTILNVLGAPSAPGVEPPDASVIGSAFQPAMGERLFSATSRWWNRYCWNSDAELGNLFGRAEGPFGEGPVVSLAGLVAEAVAGLAPPDPPPVLIAGPASVLQLPTWFWMDAGWWNAEYTDLAEHGRVSVNVEAVPHLWRLWIDGKQMAVCGGRGREYEARFRDDHPQACTFTFIEGPPGKRVPLVAEVEMAVSWTTSVEGYRTQSLPPLLRSSTADHAVIEVIGLR